MIAYDPRTWLRPVVQFHRADTFSKLLPLLLVVGLYTWGIGYLELRYLKLTYPRSRFSVKVTATDISNGDVVTKRKTFRFRR